MQVHQRVIARSLDGKNTSRQLPLQVLSEAQVLWSDT